MALQRYNKSKKSTDTLLYGASPDITPVIEKDPTKFKLDTSTLPAINDTSFIKFSYFSTSTFNKNNSSNNFFVGVDSTNNIPYIGIGTELLTQYVTDISILSKNIPETSPVKCNEVTVHRLVPKDNNITISTISTKLVDYESFKTNNDNINSSITNIKQDIDKLYKQDIPIPVIGPATNKGTDNKFVTVTVSTDRGKVTDVSVITQNIAREDQLLNINAELINIKNRIGDSNSMFIITDTKGYISQSLQQDSYGKITQFTINVNYATATSESGIVDKELLVEYVNNIILQTIEGLQNQINEITGSLKTFSDNITDVSNRIIDVSNRINRYKLETDSSISDIKNDLSTIINDISNVSTKLNTYKIEIDSSISDISNRLSTYKTQTNISINNINSSISDISNNLNTYKTQTNISISNINTSISDISTRISNLNYATTTKPGTVKVGFTKGAVTDGKLNLPINIDANGNLYVTVSTQDIKDLGFGDDSFTPVYLTTP